jgi:ParB-like chromosome segregation protein Spo0J
MNIKCSFDQKININDLRAHDKNPNSHSDDQVTRLAQIMRYQGIRSPVIVSRLSSKVVAGHGRIEALKELHKEFPDEQWDQVPVNFQDFENEEQEYLYLVSDNAIAEWSELNLAQINADIVDIGPVEIELLGLKDFEVEPSEKKKRAKMCPHCGLNVNEQPV